jgi:hypothetical protein
MTNAPPGLVKLTLVSVSAVCLTATAALLVAGVEYVRLRLLAHDFLERQQDMSHCRERLMPQCQADLAQQRQSGKTVLDTCEGQVERQCRTWATQ